MFLFRERQYPKASEIHQETDRKTKYKFLSYAPREEIEKLNLAQVEFLYDIARYMPKPSNFPRSSDVALYLLVMRKWQIQREEELRKNGIEPEPMKEEVSLFSKFTLKIAGFFKPSKENNYSLIDNNISTPLRQLPH